MRSSCSYFFCYYCGIHVSIKTSALLLEVAKKSGRILKIYMLTFLPHVRLIQWSALLFGLCWSGKMGPDEVCILSWSCQFIFGCVTAKSPCGLLTRAPLLIPGCFSTRSKRRRATSPNFPMVGKLYACWFLKFHSYQLIFCLWVLGRGKNKQTKTHIRVFWGTLWGRFLVCCFCWN